MKKQLHFVAIMGLLIAFLSGCTSYPGYDDANKKQLISFTQYQVDKDFKAYSTFSLPDKLKTPVVNGKDTSFTDVDDKWGILPQIAASMQQGGKVLTDAASSDLQISAMVFEITSTNVYYYWNWWYYDPFFYPYYPYYPYEPYIPSAYVDMSHTGWVMIRIYDRQQAGESPVVMSALVRGLGQFPHSNAEIQSAVNDCFVQSPFKPIVPNY